MLQKGAVTDQKGETHVRRVNDPDVVVARGSPSRNLALIAGGQRGRISTRQLLLAGYSRRMIRTAVANGALHRLHQGVYAVGHLAEIEFGRETAALLAAGSAAALVSITALEVLNVIPPEPGRPVHVALLDGCWSKTRPGVTVHRYKPLPSQIKIRHGLPTTTAERALLDAAPLLTPRQLERAFDEAIAIRATSRTKVLDLLSTTQGRIGQAQLAALADPSRASARTKSDPEKRALQLIREAGLPPPETQHPMYGYEADFYWPDAGVVLEVDGFQVHGMVRGNFVRDRRKDRVFRDHGLVVIRAADEELDDQPLQLVAHLARTIAEGTLRRVSRVGAAAPPAPPT